MVLWQCTKLEISLVKDHLPPELGHGLVTVTCCVWYCVLVTYWGTVWVMYSATVCVRVT